MDGESKTIERDRILKRERTELGSAGPAKDNPDFNTVNHITAKLAYNFVHWVNESYRTRASARNLSKEPTTVGTLRWCQVS